jgi:hypothetical protein
MLSTMRLLCACAQLPIGDALRVKFYPLLLAQLAEDGVGASANDALPVARAALFGPTLSGGRGLFFSSRSLASLPRLKRVK